MQKPFSLRISSIFIAHNILRRVFVSLEASMRTMRSGYISELHKTVVKHDIKLFFLCLEPVMHALLLIRSKARCGGKSRKNVLSGIISPIAKAIDIHHGLDPKTPAHPR